jgi:hypothetical protein
MPVSSFLTLTSRVIVWKWQSAIAAVRSKVSSDIAAVNTALASNIASEGVTA